jgi:hypothetical protein
MNAQSPPILLGCRVVVDLVDAAGETERREFTLVSEQQADFKAGLLGESTPLGRALLGRRPGEAIPYRVGDLREVQIVAVEAGVGTSSEAADKRRAAVQKAKDQSEITSQMIFATARGSKWGEYDVDIEKLMKDDDQDTPS